MRRLRASRVSIPTNTRSSRMYSAAVQPESRLSFGPLHSRPSPQLPVTAWSLTLSPAFTSAERARQAALHRSPVRLSARSCSLLSAPDLTSFSRDSISISMQPYVTYVLTGIIVVVSVLMDVLKNKDEGRVRLDKKKLKNGRRTDAVKVIGRAVPIEKARIKIKITAICGKKRGKIDMRKTRILSVLLATMLVALPLASCGTQTEGGNGDSSTTKDKTIAVVAKGRVTCILAVGKEGRRGRGIQVRI